MKAWTWGFLLLVAVLFMWSMSREGFQDTLALHGPPYGGCVKDATGKCATEDDYIVISRMMTPSLVTALETENNAIKPTAPIRPSASDTARYNADLLAYYRKLVDGKISDVMGDFHTSVYQPASAPLTSASVETFLTTRAKSGFLKTNKDGVKALLIAYFVAQTQGAANAGQTAAQIASAQVASESGYESILVALGQGTPPSPTCPSGYTMSADKKTCTGTSPTDTKPPTCVTGFKYANGACTVTGGGSGGGSGSGSGGQCIL